jgi:hypothetical protein
VNKNILFITFAVLAGIALLGAAVLAIVRPDASATFIAQASTLLGLVTVAAGTFAGIDKVGKQVEQVKKQTNGTLSLLLAERDEALAKLAKHDAEAAARLLLDKPGPDHRAEASA